jgi:penicillin amidase
MDFWRHIGSGRLSEMFGDSQLETDQFIRTLGWGRVARQELETLDAESRTILEAYSAGVNAYLAEHQGAALSLEYAVLKLLNASYQPEPWEPLHSLTWAKVMSWDLGGNMDGELERAMLLNTLTPEQLADLVPEFPSDHPYILPNFRLGAANSSSQVAFSDPARAVLGSPGLSQALRVASRRVSALAALAGPAGTGIGSNNWVVSGERTASGMPILANDPHLGVQMPSIWYEVGLHCRERTPDCRLNIVGFSFAGAPGVIIGHNERIAWGFTNVEPDVQDLYIEKINPQNPNQYQVKGEWVDMDLVQETIQVAGAEPVEVTARYTRHGPLISDTYEVEFIQELGGSPALGGVQPYALALRWTALDNSRTFPAIWQMNLAQNWDEFRAAVRLFDVPSQNMVYADVEGNIGYQTPGRIPLRASGDGTLPEPGWTDDYEWTGYIPFEELPFTFNPPEGYVATANQPVVGSPYPYLIGVDFDYGFRARRIVDMIEGAPGPIDFAYIQKMQGDNMNLLAVELAPLLLGMPLDDTRLENARALLEGWDYQDHMDSAPAALFNAFTRQLLATAFHDDLPEDYWPGGGGRWWQVLRQLVKAPDSPWWDDETTSQAETRDAIFLRALSAAVDELEQSQGEDPQGWKWGDLHTVTFRNGSLGESGVAPIEALFNRGPFRASGGDSIVNATGWDAAESYEVDSLPSMRMIVDLGDLGNSLSVHTTGQSGHAYHPHYVDLADLWRLIQYHPMLWERSQVEAVVEDYLRLMP